MTRHSPKALIVLLATFVHIGAGADPQNVLPRDMSTSHPVEELIVESDRRNDVVVRPDTMWAVYYDHRLGTRLYRQGRYAEAFPYLLTAARHGFKYAQAQLGYLYLAGIGGVEQDNEAAVGWLGVASTGKTMPEIRNYYKDILAQVPEALQDDADAVVASYDASYGTRVNRVTCKRRGPRLVCTFDDEISGDDSSVRDAGPFEYVSYGRYPMRQTSRPPSSNFNLPATRRDDSLFEPKDPTYEYR